MNQSMQNSVFQMDDITLHHAWHLILKDCLKFGFENITFHIIFQNDAQAIINTINLQNRHYS